MQLEIRPEPPGREHDVIAQALARMAGAPKDDRRTPWWRVGVRANLAVDAEAEEERALER